MGFAMKIKKHIIITILMISLLFFSGCSKAIYPDYYITASETDNSKKNTKFILSGSTSMTSLCNALAESFMSKYPDIQVEKSDTGSGAAVESVLNGHSIIGDLSRNLKEDEKSENLESITIAYDGIAVIVNKENPISDLSYSQLQDIFTGKISTWKSISGNDSRITLVGREEASGTKDGFESALNIVSKTKYDVQYQENGDIIAKVGNDVSAIGYCSLFSISENTKAISISGIFPTIQNISDGQYTLIRPFIEVYNKQNKNETIDLWFNFIRSDTGREIILNQGLIPTNEH